MNGRVGKLTCRYRCHGDLVAAAALAARLDRVMAEQLPAALEGNLEHVFGRDPTVYVLRRVDARRVLPVSSKVTDQRLAARWGERMAGDVARQIARAGADAGNLVRFDDEADFVASFVVDLLEGRAWARWFYGAFACYRAGGAAETLGRLLPELGDRLPPVLALLSRRGALGRLLAALGRGVCLSLWSEWLDGPLSLAMLRREATALRSDPGRAADALTGPLSAALAACGVAGPDQRKMLRALLNMFEAGGGIEGLLAALEEALSAAGDTAARRDALRDALQRRGLEKYLMTLFGAPVKDGAESAAALRPLFVAAIDLIDALWLWAGQPGPRAALFRRFTASAPGPVDWRDPRSLAIAVDAVIAFLEAEGALARRPAAGILAADLERALRRLDWLDRAWLSDALLQRLAPRVLASGEPPDPALPRRAAKATPRQRELLADIAAAARTAGLAPALGAGPENLIRLYSALVARNARWSEDAAAKRMVQMLLEAAALPLGAARAAALAHLAVGELEAPPALGSLGAQGGQAGALGSLGSQGSQAGALGALDGLGAPAALALAQLVKAGQAGTAGETVESACAGLALLMRALTDFGLPSLVARVAAASPGLPAELPPWIAALALRWAGEAGADETGLDPAVGWLAGLDQSADLESLRAAWTGAGAQDCRMVQQEMLQRLIALRAVKGDTLWLFCIDPAAGRPVLFAVGGDVRLWLLAEPLDRPTAARAVLRRWEELWRAARGRAPGFRAGPELAAALGRRLPATVTIVDSGDDAAELGAGRRDLEAGVAAFGGGRLGLVTVDLTLMLIAGAALHLWARWLQGFAASSSGYLLDGLIRRPGRLNRDQTELMVELPSGPLDVVLEMAGYGEELPNLPWLDGRALRFKLGEAL